MTVIAPWQRSTCVIVLVDTNVLLDVALDRAPDQQSAADLLDLLESRPGTGFVAWHSLSNFCYLVMPRLGAADTKAFITDLARFIQVAQTTTDDLRFALNLDMRDFEDAMQVAGAKACEAEVIATRNVRDYRNSPIRAATPKTVISTFF